MQQILKNILNEKQTTAIIANGSIQFENVKFRYFKSGPTVLNNLSLTIPAKQKVGIVGRTGAGKSSLIAALFWFDQSVMLDAISSAENNYEWTTFSGEKLNFTKWGYGHPQLYDGVTFSAYYKPNSTDPPSVRVMNWHKIYVY